MPSSRRDTYGSRREPEYSDYDSYSEDDSHREPRRPRAPTRKSTAGNIIDRVSRSIGRLGINRSPSRTRRARVISPSPSPPPTSRRPGYDRHHSDSYYPPSSSRPRHTRHGSSYSLSPPRTRDSGRSSTRRDRAPLADSGKLAHAARSALDAAVVEVMRVRKEPGKWTGPKGGRVVTAALGAAAVDAFVSKNSSDPGKKKSIESALGGLLLNRMVNGGRKELRKDSRSRR